MIILVTLMVAASRVLSVPIDDLPDSSYVAIDTTVPVRIDPATITRLYRDQSSYPVSSPPFNEGFYYTVPARLLLYQPPPGQSYPAGRASAKEHGNSNNQLNPPISVGEYVQSSQRQYKRSSDQAGISADELPYGNYPGGASQYANYYDQSSGYHQLGPSSSAASEFSGRSDHSDSRSYNYVNPSEVQEEPGHFREPSYSQRIPVSYGNSQQAISRASQDYQDVQSVGYLNNRLQDSWPQSTLPEPDPGNNYGTRSIQNVYAKYPRGPSSSPDSGPRFPLYEELNAQRYVESNDPGESSETVSWPEPSDLRYQTSRNLSPGSQSHPMVNHREYSSNSPYSVPSPVGSIVPQSSQISPSYLVGFKLLTKTPSLSTLGCPIWDLPNFPKHMVEPWASKMHEDGAYSAGRSGFQSQPIDSSRAVAPSNVGFRSPPRGVLPGAKGGTPWVVLMVPPDSLFKKEYDTGIKIPWLSLNPRTHGKEYTFAGQGGTPICQKENSNAAETQLRQSNIPLEVKRTLSTEPQHLVSGGWDSQPLVGQVSGLERTKNYDNARSVATQPVIKNQFQNQQALSQVIQDQTIMTDGNISPSTVTNYMNSDSSSTQPLTERTGEDRFISTVSQNDVELAREVHPGGEEASEGSQQLASQLSDMGYTSMGGTEIDTGRLQAESMLLGSDSSSNDAERALAASEFKSSSSGLSSAPNLEHSMIAGEDLIQNMKLQKDELVHSLGSVTSHIDSGSTGVQQVMDGAETMRTQIQGGGLTSKVIHYVTETASDEKFIDHSNTIGSTQLHIPSGGTGTQHITQAGQAPHTISTIVEGGMRNQDQSKSVQYEYTGNSGPQQVNGLGSTTTILGGAPSSSRIIRYESSGGALGENLGESNIMLMNGEVNGGGSSTITRYVTTGSTGTQQVVEEGSSSQTISTLVDGGSSGSRVIRYGTEGSPSGSEGQSEVVQHNLTSYTGPQQAIQKANGLESTTTTTTRGEVQGNVNETNIGWETEENSPVTQVSESSSTGELIKGTSSSQVEINQAAPSASQVITYATEVGTVLGSRRYSTIGNDTVKQHPYDDTDIIATEQQVVEQSNPVESKTIRYTASGEKQGSEVESGPNTSTQYRISGDRGVVPNITTTIVKGAPTTNTVIRYITTADGQRQEIVDESNLALGNDGLLSVADTNPTGSGSMGVVSKSTSTIKKGAPSTNTVIRYITTADGQRQEIVDESNLALGNDGLLSVTDTNPAISRSMGIVPKSTTTIVKGAPMTTKIIRYITTADGQRQEIVDESNATIENDGHSSVSDINPAVVPKSTSTFVKGAPMGTKIIRYITTADGQRQEIVDESNAAIENYGHSSVSDINPAVVPKSTSTFVKGAPMGTKIIRYITTADGQRQEIVDESNAAIENDGHSSVSDINPAVVPKSTSTFVKGAPMGTKIIRYITTADGQRQEIVDESNAAIENDSVSLVTDTNPVEAGVMGVGQNSERTFVKGAPTTTKIIRYITTADGQRQEIVDESNVALGNDGLSSMADINTAGAGVLGVAPKSTTTFVNGAPTKTKTIRYITTADGQRQEIVDESNAAIENDGHSSMTELNPAVSTSKTIRYVTNAGGAGQASLGTEGTGHVVIEGNEFQSTSSLENGPSSSRTIRYLKPGGMEQQFGQPMTTGNDGQSSVTRFFRTGSAGGQEVVDQDTVAESVTTVLDGSPASYKTTRYVSYGGAETHEMDGTSNNNQTSQTVTRYITGTDSDSSGQTHLQQPGTTVTRYVNLPNSGGASSQFLSGPGNLQSKTIVAGAPSTVTRYSMNYPQQSGLSGMRYMQSLQQPRQTIMKPASYSSG